MKNYIYSSWKVIFAHIKMMIISLIPGTVMFNDNFFSAKIGFFYSILFAIAYVMFIYSECFRMGENDAKNHTTQQPYRSKGFLISIPLVVLSIILTVLWHFSWVLTPNSTNVAIYILRFIYLVWDFAFFGFAGMNNGYVSIIGYSIILILPVVSSGVGYLAGMYDFPVWIKLKQIMYKK